MPRVLAIFAILATTMLGLLVWRCLHEDDLIDSLRWRLGIQTQEIPRFNREMRGHLRRLARNSDPNRLVFIGDSITQGMDVSGIDCGALNLGIGGDTTRSIIARIADYPRLHEASMVVVLAGINDYSFRDNEEIADNHARILASLTPAPVLLLAVLPVDETVTGGRRSNEKIRLLNDRLQGMCRENCRFVPTHDVLADVQGNLMAAYHEGDGIHLSTLGYLVLKQRLRDAITTAGLSPQACNSE